MTPESIKSTRTKRACDASKPPAYRQRKGYDQAIVTLSDRRTKKRRDYWLGPYGTAESRERYHRLIAEWEALGRRLPKPIRGPEPPVDLITINEIMRDYWRWARSYYSPSEVTTLKSALRILRALFGTTPAIEFGPKRLKLVRDEMVRGDAHANPPRQPWSRKHINGQIHRVCAMFKWAASHEMLPASLYEQLKTLPSLKRGRCTAREGRKIRGVPIEQVEAVRPFLSRQVNALISLQLLTGARGGELLTLRPIDIVMDEGTGVWSFSPDQHKTAHHGHDRTIFFGAKAQSVIRPFLADRPLDAFLFSPTQAEEERLAARHAQRTTPMSCGNTPGSNKRKQRRRAPRDHYTPDSYRRAIERACDLAFLPPEELQPGTLPNGKRESKAAFRKRMTAEQKKALREWRKAHRWHPHQLRHTAATQIRREFGLEVARIALGHSSALVTDAVYAERDMEKVVEVMRKIG